MVNLDEGEVAWMRERAWALSSRTGAGNEARTRDLNLGKVALYQLSYSRIGQPRIINQGSRLSKLRAPAPGPARLRHASADARTGWAIAACMRVIAFSRFPMEVANEMRT